MLPIQWGSNRQPPDHQSDVHPTAPSRLDKELDSGHKLKLDDNSSACAFGSGEQLIKYFFGIFLFLINSIVHVKSYYMNYVS